MPKPHIAIIGKTVRRIARLRGGGSALPGLVVEKIDPQFTKNTLDQLPYGVVVISGTNGKTTTTKMVVELLQAHGLNVFTNRTGSNFARGVTAALLEEVSISGKLNKDIAVLELDEAHAVKFVDTIAPRYSLLLNVMRDQLDRFGEIDTTAKMLQHIAQATTKTVVLNREDTRIARIADSVTNASVIFYGLNPSLRKEFPSDDELRANKTHITQTPATTVLESYNDNHATFNLNNTQIDTSLKLNGIYNIYNAAAALCLCKAILPAKSYTTDSLTKALSTITPAFGRGESLVVDGQPLEIILVKNPSGFRLGLKSFSPKDFSTMIAINDNYADGRDMSWLWDVDFDSLQSNGVSCVSGIRAYDMALRLQYDEVKIDNVDIDIEQALSYFISSNHSSKKRIYCTYTAMLKIRKLLSKIADVERVL